MDKQSLISEIRAYATENYDSPKVAWDVLVECWSDDRITAAIGRARTLNGAVKKISPILATLREVHNDVLAAGGLPPVGTEREVEPVDAYVPPTDEEIAARNAARVAETYKPGDFVELDNQYEPNHGLVGLVRTSWVDRGERIYDVIFVVDGERDTAGAINSWLKPADALGRADLEVIAGYLDRIPGQTNHILRPLVAGLLADAERAEVCAEALAMMKEDPTFYPQPIEHTNDVYTPADALELVTLALEEQGVEDASDVARMLLETARRSAWNAYGRVTVHDAGLGYYRIDLAA